MAICNKCSDGEAVKMNQYEQNKGCGHIICHNCLCDHVETLTCAKVSCPVDGCRSTLQDNIIRKCLSNDQLQSYDQLCLSPNSVKCLVKDCLLFVASDGREGHFICEICNQPNCLKCKRLHSKNVACESIKNDNSKEFEKAAATILQLRRKKYLEKVSQDNDLIPNSDKFDCPICCTFILPREGVSLRNCMDNICGSCIKEHISSLDSLKIMNCPYNTCNRPLTERECIKLLEKDKYQRLSLELIRPRMSNCQKPECRGLWDFASFKGIYKCPLCGEENCAACGDIHKGETCDQFRKSKRFIEAQKFKKKMNDIDKITCQKCSTTIIKNGGCNAIRCPNCRLQVCGYSGLEVGPNGCKCTNSRRCVEGCHPGCIPEGETAYEKDIAEYFWNN